MVIEFSRIGLIKHLLLGAIMLLVGLLFWSIGDGSASGMAAFIGTIYRFVGGLLIILSSLALVWSTLRLIRPRPALEFREDGLWVSAPGPFAGLIPWSHLDRAVLGNFKSFSTFDIHVRDRAAIIGPLPLWRRACIATANPFSTRLVMIPAYLLDTKVEDVVQMVDDRVKSLAPHW